MKPITIKDRASPAIEKLRTALGGDLSPLLAVLGRTGANFTQAHYRGMNATHANSLGARRTNFWNEVADSVFTHGQTKTAVRVGIGHPAIAQKVYGGKIEAKRHDNLTLPMSAEAYEHPSPALSYWDGRTKIFWHRSNGILLGTEDEAGKVTWQFWLTPSVTQEPTPGALPEALAMQEQLDRVRDGYIARKLAQISTSNDSENE
jgi:hypothetical protein